MVLVAWALGYPNCYFLWFTIQTNSSSVTKCVCVCALNPVHVFSAGDGAIACKQFKTVRRVAPIQSRACIYHAAKGQ